MPSRAIRKHNKQILAKATEALASDPLDERVFGALTVAIDKSMLPELRKKIIEFRASINEMITNHDGSSDEVYVLGTQFFKITRGTNK